MSRQARKAKIYVYRYDVEGDPVWLIATEVDPIIQHVADQYGEVNIAAGPFNSKEAAEIALENLKGTEILKEELEKPKGG